MNRSRMIMHDIATAHGVSVEAIRGESRQKELLPVRRKIALALRAGGFTVENIASVMHKSESSVFYYLNTAFAERHKARARERHQEDRPPVQRGEKQIARIHGAAQSGCTTSQEIADATGIDHHTCSKFVALLVRRGELKHTGRRIPSNDMNRRSSLKVFEVVSAGEGAA